MTVPLSARLQALHDAVLPGQPVWDIGCDHGLVGLTALAEGRASRVVFVDKSARVTAALADTIAAHLDEALRDHTRVITGDAARLRPEPVTGSVVIAGVGARAIIRILSSFVLPNARDALRLVLQPEVEEERLTRWLADAGCPAPVGRVIEERGQRHVILVVDREAAGTVVSPRG